MVSPTESTVAPETPPGAGVADAPSRNVPDASPPADRTPAPASSPGAGRGVWVSRLLIVLLVFFAFHPALRHTLLPWDDLGNITRNPHVSPPSAAGLARIWTAPYDGLYVPLVYTSFAAEALLAGPDEGALARLIHFDNLVLHALAALVVFELLRRLFGEAAGKTATAAALGGSLLFALHPLQAEAVNWATGRKDLLAGLLALFSLFQYVAWRRTGRRGAFGLALASFGLALLAKPAAVAVPVAAAALDFYAFRLSPRQSLRALWPWFAAALVFAAATTRIQHAASGGNEAPFPPAWTRPFVAADALAFYMGKIVLPWGLSPVYTRPVNAVTADRTLLLLALPLAAIPLGFLLTRRSLIGAGSAVALALLLPNSGLVPFHYQHISTVADRYAYTALFGVALAAAAGGLRLAAPAAGKASRALPAAGLTAAVLVTLLGVMSWRQSRHWRNSDTLWTHALRVASGSAVVHNNLGMVYGEQGRTEEAGREFAEAVRLAPGFANAHNNLANYYSSQDQPEKAAEHYRKALEADPRHTVARANLMMLYQQAGETTEAAEHARLLLEVDPDHLLALNVRAVALGLSGRGEEALKLLRDASARRPENTDLAELLRQAEQIMAAEQEEQAPQQ